MAPGGFAVARLRVIVQAVDQHRAQPGVARGVEFFHDVGQEQDVGGRAAVPGRSSARVKSRPILGRDFVRTISFAWKRGRTLPPASAATSLMNCAWAKVAASKPEHGTGPVGDRDGRRRQRHQVDDAVRVRAGALSIVIRLCTPSEMAEA